MKILITSSGRRGYMVKYFKEALGEGGIVIAGNAIDNVPSFFEADQTVITPFVSSPDFIPFLVEYCAREKVDAVLPLYDVDVPVLARAREKFAKVGTRLIISDERVAELCNDKWKAYQYFIHNNFKTPNTFIDIEDALAAVNSGELVFPLIVKPRFGNGSIAVSKARDANELLWLYKMAYKTIMESWLSFESQQEEKCVIIQEMIHADEYGVDIINDLEGNYQNCIIKRKLGMRSGETDSALIVKNEMIRETCERLGKSLHHVANMDCDGFVYQNDFYILEMNARFGGGYPFSHTAGANIPLAIVKWLKNEEVSKELLTATTGAYAYKDIEIKPAEYTVCLE